MKNRLMGVLFINCIIFACVLEYIYKNSGVVPVSRVSDVASISFEAIAPSYIHSGRFELSPASVNAIVRGISYGSDHPSSDGAGFPDGGWLNIWVRSGNDGGNAVKCGFDIGSCTISIPVFFSRREAILGSVRYIHAKLSPLDCEIISTNIVFVEKNSRAPHGPL